MTLHRTGRFINRRQITNLPYRCRMFSMIPKVLLSSALIFPFAAYAEVRLLRHPSYSKSKVAFSYLGDICTANENCSVVVRLPVHKVRDIYPRLSRDGNCMAFSSH